MQQLKKPARAAAAAAALAFTLAAATAQADNWSRIHADQQATRYDYAEVIDARPIIRQVRVERPVRECWQDVETRRVHTRRGGNPGAALAGGVIGGVIGNQFGSGRGNDAATIVGALVGAAIGSDSGRRHRHGPAYATESYPVERCDTHIETTTEERVDGYDVTYVYNGQTLRTRMPNPPGERIRVRVSVAPAR